MITWTKDTKGVCCNRVDSINSLLSNESRVIIINNSMDAPITWLIDRLNQQHLYAAICNLRLHDDHNDEILSSFLNYPVLSLRDASLYSKIHQQEIIKNIRFDPFFVPSQFSLRIKNSRNASLSKRDIGSVITSTSCKWRNI